MKSISANETIRESRTFFFRFATAFNFLNFFFRQVSVSRRDRATQSDSWWTSAKRRNSQTSLR